MPTDGVFFLSRKQDSLRPVKNVPFGEEKLRDSLHENEKKVSKLFKYVISKVVVIIV